MLPQFGDQDYIIAMSWPWLSFKPGDAVLVLHSSLGLIVKRILTVSANHYELVGDHPSSISSKQIGWVERGQIVGRVVFHIPRRQPYR